MQVEEVFDFREFLIKLLRSWRVVLLLMIFCSFIFGGFRLYQLRSLLIADMPDEVVYIAELVNISEAEIQILNLERSAMIFSERLNLLEQVTLDSSYSMSFYMNISVDGDLVNLAHLTNIYAWFAQSRGFYEWVALRLDRTSAIPASHLEELITVRELPHIQGILEVIILGDTPEFCISVAYIVQEYFETLDLYHIFGENYSIQRINMDDSPSFDIALFQRKVEIMNFLQEEQSIIRSLESELAASKLSETDMQPQSPRLFVALRSSFLYGAVGLIGGLIFGIVVAFFFDIMSQKVRDSSDIIKKLDCTIPVTILKHDKRRVLSFVDNWIDLVDGNRVSHLTHSNAIEKICADIAISLGERAQGYRLFITGTIPLPKLTNIHSDVSVGLSVDGVLCILGESILVSPKSTRALINCDGILLVEQNAFSTIPEVERELMLARLAEKQIVGLVWIT